MFQVHDDGENGHNEDEYTAYLREKGMLETFRSALRQGGYRHPFDDPDDTADGFIGLHGIRFVEDYHGEQPFYLNLSFIGPHPPLWHPGELQHEPQHMPPPVGAPDEPSVRLRRAHYMDRCALIDRYVGRLVEAIERRGLGDRTVIIFTSDHGDCLGDHGIWDKRFFYESSVGVPLFLCGPQVAASTRGNAPRVSKALASHLDLYPTILSLAGVEAAADRRRPGLDLLAMERGEPQSSRDAVFAELATFAMVRTANWKLVFDPEQAGVQQLYNLIGDPQEERNLAGTAGYEHVTIDLLQRLLTHRISLTQYTHVKEEQHMQRVWVRAE